MTPSLSRSAVEQLIEDLLLYLDDRGATAQFDAIAEKFYRETGFMRPGKSVPLEMAGCQIEERRAEAWQKWCRAWRLKLIAELSSLLAVSGETREDEQKNEEKDFARVDGVPEGAHGDLPRRVER